MGKYEREKGARGERMWRDVCRENGYDAERGCQLYQRGDEIADVIGLPGIHQEVKFVEHLNLRDALSLSVCDAEREGKGNIPIVASKKKYSEWIVTMRARDWFTLYREWEAGKNEQIHRDGKAH